MMISLIENEELCIKNEELCIQNGEFCSFLTSRRCLMEQRGGWSPAACAFQSAVSAWMNG